MLPTHAKGCLTEGNHLPSVTCSTNSFEPQYCCLWCWCFPSEAVPTQCSLCFRPTILLAWFAYQEVALTSGAVYSFISDKSCECLTDTHMPVRLLKQALSSCLQNCLLCTAPVAHSAASFLGLCWGRECLFCMGLVCSNVLPVAYHLSAKYHHLWLWTDPLQRLLSRQCGLLCLQAELSNQSFVETPCCSERAAGGLNAEWPRVCNGRVLSHPLAPVSWRTCGEMVTYVRQTPTTLLLVLLVC